MPSETLSSFTTNICLVVYGSPERYKKTIKGRDGQIRGAEVKVVKRDRQQDLLRRPIQLLYPLEVCILNPPDATTDPEISSADTSPPEPAKEDEKTEVIHSKEAGKTFSVCHCTASR